VSHASQEHPAAPTPSPAGSSQGAPGEPNSASAPGAFPAGSARAADPSSDRGPGAASLPLVHLAHARSGDKGDTANVGVIAYDPEDYPLLRELLTAQRVKAHFGPLVRGEVERFELPNLHALNFLLHGALGGGGTVSLMTDAQGKVFSTALLRMEVEVPEAVARRAMAGGTGRGRVPPGYDPEAPVPAPAFGAAVSGAPTTQEGAEGEAERRQGGGAGSETGR
jgi:hypothetical protein